MPTSERHNRSATLGPSEETVAGIHDRYAAMVERCARRLAGPRFDAEDPLREVFRVVLRRWGEFRGDAKVTTWLFRITLQVVRCRRRNDNPRWPLPSLPRHLCCSQPGPCLRPYRRRPTRPLTAGSDYEVVLSQASEQDSRLLERAWSWRALAWQRAGNRDQARAAAAEYLRRLPGDAFAAQARLLAEPEGP